MTKKTEKAHNAYTVQENSLPPFDPTVTTLGNLMPDDIDAFVGEDAESNEAFDFLNKLTDEELLYACKPRLCENCPEFKKAQDERLLNLADLDNARKRMQREKDEFVRFATEKVLSDIIPAIDTLNLALQHAATDDVCKNFVVGVEMTKKSLIDSLKTHGLNVVGTVGEEFDPSVHEAVGLDSFADIAPDHIGAVFAKGFTLHGRLLRPARVIVCKK